MDAYDLWNTLTIRLFVEADLNESTVIQWAFASFGTSK